MFHCVALRCFALRCVVLHRIVLHCIALHYNVFFCILYLYHSFISMIFTDFSTVADTSCSRSYSAGPTGTITSYNYPFNYTSNLRCQYIIQIPYTGDNYYYATKRVCFTFHRFKLESYLNHASEPVDYLAFIVSTSLEDKGCFCDFT